MISDENYFKPIGMENFLSFKHKMMCLSAYNQHNYIKFQWCTFVGRVEEIHSVKRIKM